MTSNPEERLRSQNELGKRMDKKLSSMDYNL